MFKKFYPNVFCDYNILVIMYLSNNFFSSADGGKLTKITVFRILSLRKWNIFIEYFFQTTSQICFKLIKIIRTVPDFLRVDDNIGIEVLIIYAPKPI